MNLESHIYIGRLLHRELTDLLPYKLNKVAFVLGNVAPDYMPHIVTHPHYASKSSDYLDGRIEYIANRPGFCDLDPFISTSFRLGVVAHYIADFFCEAHANGKIGNAREHLQYEDWLDNYRRGRVHELDRKDWLGGFEPFTHEGDITGFLKKRINEYKTKAISIDNDIRSAIEVGLKVIASVLTIRLQRSSVNGILVELEQALSPAWATESAKS